MSKKSKSYTSVEQMNQEEENSLLTPRQSDEEIKEQRRQEKAAARAQKKAERQAKAADPQEKNALVRMLVILLIAIIVIGGFLAVVGYTHVFDKFIDPKGVNTKLGHFYGSDTPELSEEGIKGVVTEAYYTNDGHLALVLKLSNGLNTKHYLKSLSMTVKNENDEVIATGYTDSISDSFYIEPMNYRNFTFYISPEFVKLANDDLDNLTYELTTTGQVEDPSVLPSTTAAEASQTTTTAA